jgi:hypothetical protein
MQGMKIKIKKKMGDMLCWKVVCMNGSSHLKAVTQASPMMHHPDDHPYPLLMKTQHESIS